MLELEYEWKHKDKSFQKTNEPTILFTNNYSENVSPDESSANIIIRYSSDYDSENLENM